MQKDTATSSKSAEKTFNGLTALQPVFPARTFPRQAVAAKRALPVSKGLIQACFSKPCVLSESYSPLGLSLKTSRGCSLATVAKTLRESCKRLPLGGIWDSGGCLMLNISECPKGAVGFSWWRVLDDTPQSSTWLTESQWKQYLSRLARSLSHRQRWSSLPILSRRRTSDRKSELVVKSLLRNKGCGIRWLSGNEALAYEGFPKDWMMPTLQCTTRLVMRWFQQSRNGSPKS